MSLVGGRGAHCAVGRTAEPHAGNTILVGDARHALEERVLHDGRIVAIEEHAGRLARAVDEHLGVVGSCRRTRDACLLHRHGVGDRRERAMAPPAPRRADVDGMVGRYSIEVLPGREATLGQLLGPVDVVGRRRPHRHGDDPLSLRRPRDGLPNPLHDLGHRRAALERDATSRLQSLPVHVRMPVEEAGRHDLAGRIQDPGLRSAPTHDVCIGADGAYLSVSDREGLGDGRAGVEGDDLRATHDQIRLGHVGDCSLRKERGGVLRRSDHVIGIRWRGNEQSRARA